MNTTMNPSPTTDREIVISRRFDAPRELVWRAWAEPERIEQWWGPTGFTTTVHEMDFRPGGVLRHTMHAPDGTDFPDKIVYREITPHERITYLLQDDAGEWDPIEAFVTFAEVDGGTEVTMRMVFATLEAKRMVVEEYGAIEGGHQTLARLADYLAPHPETM